MPLPAGGSKVPWPPDALTKSYSHFREHSAWYSGDPNQLAAVYYGAAAIDQYMGQPDRSTLDKPSAWQSFKRNFFWARPTSTIPYQRVRLHVPLAGDIAATSANLLFAEPIALEIPNAHKPHASSKAKASQGRLDELVELCSLRALFLEAGEAASALGGVYLKVDWDTGFADHPIVTAVHSDAAIPEFKWNLLQSVTFWRVVQEDGPVWRHLECRDPGYISHGLYRGSRDTLGVKVPLTDLAETAPLASGAWNPDGGDVQPEGVIETPTKRLTAVYAPNLLPNRLDRGSSLGRSDYQGAEGFLDGLDEIYTSLMRDIRLARARLVVPEDWFQTAGRGKGATFDLDEEVFTKLPGMPAEGEITSSQFAIRVADHQTAARDFVERIVATAGYSAATFGVMGDTPAPRTVTATEIQARERRSLITRERKAYYWSKPLTDILRVLLEIDSAVFGQSEPQPVSVVFPDSAPVDPQAMATTVELLARAEALSAATKVQMVHPEWSPDQVAAEVQLIQAAPRPAGAPSFTLPVDPMMPAPPDPGVPPA